MFEVALACALPNAISPPVALLALANWRVAPLALILVSPSRFSVAW